MEAVYVLRVPAQLSLHAGMEAEERVGRGLLESAALAGRQAGVRVRASLIRTRNPRSALIEAARRRKSDIVYLATVHAPPSEHALGPTATSLLAQRPCRIVVETETAADARRGAGTKRARHARVMTS